MTKFKRGDRVKGTAKLFMEYPDYNYLRGKVGQVCRTSVLYLEVDFKDTGRSWAGRFAFQRNSCHVRLVR